MTISLETLGFGLVPEETWDETEVFSFESPFRMLNGAPFEVFVEQVGDRFHIFDDGLTMHEILKCGIDMSKHYRWETLRKIIRPRNVSLSHEGVFELYCLLERAEESAADYLRAMFSVDDWLTMHVRERRPGRGLVEESKRLFKRWHPDDAVVDRPKLQGISGVQLEFDFKIGDTYVDALSPNASASGGFIRKVVSIPRNADKNIEVLAVIDDRKESDAARQERAIISTVANTMFMTNLQANASLHVFAA